MRSLLLLLLPTLLPLLPFTTARPSPLSLPSNLSTLSPTPNLCTGHPSTQGYCTTLTYEDITLSTANPPSLSQCQTTCSNILTDAGDWGISFAASQGAGYVQQVVSGGCAFGVGRGDPGNYAFAMDNQDIVDILNEVGKRFGGAHGGRVAARGTMKCEGHVAKWYVG